MLIFEQLISEKVFERRSLVLIGSGQWASGREYWIIENQAFSPSYALAPPPPSPPSPVSKLGQRHTGRLRKRDNLLTVKGARGGGGAKSYDGEKASSVLCSSLWSSEQFLVRQLAVPSLAVPCEAVSCSFSINEFFLVKFSVVPLCEILACSVLIKRRLWSGGIMKRLAATINPLLSQLQTLNIIYFHPPVWFFCFVCTVLYIYINNMYIKGIGMLSLMNTGH